MAWRASHYVAAGAVVAGAGYWAASAWAGRRLPVARPIVVTDAYDHFTDSLRRREILADEIGRAHV